MKPIWWFVGMTVAASLSAAESIPVDDFARPPLVSQMALSPDGQYVAFLREVGGRKTLFLSDLKTRQLSEVHPADARGTFQSKDVRWFNWVSARRLVFTTIIWDHWIAGISAVDRDGRQWKTISGSEAKIPNEDPLFANRVVHCFDDQDQSVLALGIRIAQGSRLWDTNPRFLDVVKVNTVTGHYAVMAKNPGNVVGWGMDQAGCVRVGMTTDGTKRGIIYRENGDASWRSLPAFGPERGDVRPLGFDRSNQQLYVAALSPRSRWAVYPFDPAGGGLGKAVIENPEYDIIPEHSTPELDGIPIAGLVPSQRPQGVAGVYYVTERPQVRWFEEEAAAHQRAIDRALPDTFNLIISRAGDDRFLLVLASSDRDPGTYYLYDRVLKSLTLVATRMKWIDPERMAAMEPIEYPARDGLLIHGYVTYPPGVPRENLPLVVMPHGGPWVRDVWGFDPLVQMLASRGYAVLQMNYRGSTGYGEDFYKQGRREVGAAIQNDIEDGTRWAISQGLADPKRIAIVGGSFGGYSALFALGHNPELYRCGVSIAGVTDWPAIYEQLSNPEDRIARQYWVEAFGDPQTDAAALRAISPVNFADKITAPVLIIQGKEDHIVPPKQARELVAALEKAGRTPAAVFLADAGHNWGDNSTRVEAFRRIEAFLAKNLAP
jgi:dipeptidyl aminopeptidase/acylaminoacyl peptidase